jgi:hypothetical protein
MAINVQLSPQHTSRNCYLGFSIINLICSKPTWRINHNWSSYHYHINRCNCNWAKKTQERQYSVIKYLKEATSIKSPANDLSVCSSNFSASFQKASKHCNQAMQKSINLNLEEKPDKLNFIQVTSTRQFKLKSKRITEQTLIQNSNQRPL